MKCINQWLGIIMAVMLAAGSVQVPVYAAETGATVTEAEGETDSFESAETAADAEPEIETEIDSVDEESTEEDSVDDATQEESVPENLDTVEDTQDIPTEIEPDISSEEPEALMEEESADQEVSYNKAEEEQENVNWSNRKSTDAESEIAEEAFPEEEANESVDSVVVYEGRCGDNAVWKLHDDGTLYVSGTGELIMNNKSYETGATFVNWNSLNGHSCVNEIKKAVIGEGITTINSDAFENCHNLVSVSMADTVTEIRWSVFSNCENLKTVNLSNSLKIIYNFAFSGCTSLESLSLPDSLKEIRQFAFYGSGLKSLTIPKDMEVISSSIVEKTPLEELYISGDIATWGPAFEFAQSLKTVILAEGLTYIGQGAFRECTALTEIEIPKSVGTIRHEAFSSCRSLHKVVFRGDAPYFDNCGVTGEYYFWNCELTAYYPADNPTWTSDKLQNYGGTITWKPYYSDVSKCTVTLSNTSMVYNGQAQTPVVNIENGGMEMKAGTDYSVSYSDNINAGTATVTVTGIGKYTGTVNKTFTITKAAPTLSFASASVSKKTTDSAFTNTLTKETDGTVTFKSSNTAVATVNSSTGQVTIKGAGSTTITATAAAGTNYAAGTASYTLTVTAVSTTTYTVKFDANGGTGTPSTQSKQENVPLTLSSNKPTKRYVISYNAAGGSVSPASKNVSCTFKNWNTKKDGSGTAYAAGASYTANADVTLYAQWTNPKAGTLATPTRSGYTFSGWFSAATGGTQIKDSSTVAGNMTIYAHWSGNIYNLGDETYSFGNYGDSDSFGGHCFGMSITSAGYYNSLIDIGRVGGGANTSLYQLSLTNTVKKPICYYQGIQGSYAANAIVAGGSSYLTGYSDIDSDWPAVVNYVKNHKYDGTGLLQIGFRKNGEGGHAINFLRYESVNGQDRIYAYDNNFPNTETYFYKNSNGAVLQAPLQTFSGSIDCIALRNARTYFSIVGDFNSTHVLYMPKDAAEVLGYTYTLMEGAFPEDEYVMYEIPEDQDKVTIIPNRDYADFIYMDTEYSFGEVTDETRGELKFSTMDETSGGSDASFVIYENKPVTPTVTLSKNSYTYNGSVQKPTVTVKVDGVLLKKDQDYTLEYPLGMIDAGTYKITVELKGKYSGTIFESYTIKAKSVTPTITLSKTSLPYTGNALKPAITVTAGSTTLKEGTDYTTSYSNNINIGTGTVKVTCKGNYKGSATKTFTIVLGKTSRGDMFNLANNVKVTWKEVPGAKYYKVYREGVTDSKESVKAPVIVTTGLVGWDAQPGLTNGHAYRYKIVASLTGKGDSSGDSTRSYSKLMYRLKTVVIRSVKNTAPGKVTVKYDKTTSGDSYVLQYSENQDMTGAKTKVVLGANNTYYTIGGLKKGKTYYISIRVRKKVDGIDYYTTFGVAKKVTITK